MSQLVRLDGKHTAQTAHCALAAYYLHFIFLLHRNGQLSFWQAYEFGLQRILKVLNSQAITLQNGGQFGVHITAFFSLIPEIPWLI